MTTRKSVGMRKSEMMDDLDGKRYDGERISIKRRDSINRKIRSDG